MVADEEIKVRIHFVKETHYRGDVYMTRGEYERLDGKLTGGSIREEMEAELEVANLATRSILPFESIELVTFCSEDAGATSDGL